MHPKCYQALIQSAIDWRRQSAIDWLSPIEVQEWAFSCGL